MFEGTAQDTTKKYAIDAALGMAVDKCDPAGGSQTTAATQKAGAHYSPTSNTGARDRSERSPAGHTRAHAREGDTAAPPRKQPQVAKVAPLQRARVRACACVHIVVKYDGKARQPAQHRLKCYETPDTLLCISCMLSHAMFRCSIRATVFLHLILGRGFTQYMSLYPDTDPLRPGFLPGCADDDDRVEILDERQYGFLDAKAGHYAMGAVQGTNKRTETAWHVAGLAVPVLPRCARAKEPGSASSTASTPQSASACALWGTCIGSSLRVPPPRGLAPP